LTALLTPDDFGDDLGLDAAPMMVNVDLHAKSTWSAARLHAGGVG
jgi:hypothetical protein